jgi:hypothetical protein
MDVDTLLQKNELLKKAVEIIKPVADADPLGNTASVAYRVVRNVLRKNVMRVQAIAVLNTYDKMSDSALEIARNTIEDSISVSYILSDPTSPEKLAHQFFEFRWVQAKQDLDYYSKIPDYIGEDLDKNRQMINEGFKRVIGEYPDFTNDDGSPRNSWSRQGVDGMAKQLVKRKLYTVQEMRNLLRAYQRGSRKTHFNPVDILGFHDQDTWDKSSITSLDIAIKAVAAGFTSLVVRYFDIVSHYDKTVDGSDTISKLYDIQEQIHKLG